jgi:hypothetical protein
VAKNAWKLGEERASMRYLRETHPKGICQLNTEFIQCNMDEVKISETIISKKITIFD